MITLTTSDNVDIPIEREVAERSILIKNLLEDLGSDGTEAIPVPNVCPSPPSFPLQLLASFFWIKFSLCA